MRTRVSAAKKGWPKGLVLFRVPDFDSREETLLEGCGVIGDCVLVDYENGTGVAMWHWTYVKPLTPEAVTMWELAKP